MSNVTFMNLFFIFFPQKDNGFSEININGIYEMPKNSLLMHYVIHEQKSARVNLSNHHEVDVKSDDLQTVTWVGQNSQSYLIFGLLSAGNSSNT